MTRKISRSLRATFFPTANDRADYGSIRHLSDVLVGFSVASFMCCFAPYFVSFSLNPIVYSLRLIGTLMALLYMLRNFYPIRWQQQLIRYDHMFYFFNGIFTPLTIYFFEPNQGTLIIAVVFFVATSLVFSWQKIVLSLGMTGAGLFLLLLYFDNPLDNLWIEKYLAPGILLGFFSATFGMLTHQAIQKRFYSLNALAQSIAHELKTPMASIHLSTALAEKLIDENNLVQAKKKLNMIQTILTNTNETIMLSLNGLKTGAIQAPLSALPAKDVLQECVSSYPFTETEKQAVQTDIKISSKTHIFANTFLLKGILHNLIKNALEALEEKDQEFSLKIAIVQNQDHHIEIRVRDTGVGIPYAHALKIFDSPRTTKTHGCGAGLTYSYQAALYMYGDLFCYSEPGKWTEFVLKLPIIRRDLPSS